MGAIKTYDYTTDEFEIAIMARGISHPARVRMLKQLKIGTYRNIDFCKDLCMTKSTVKDHLDKLCDADLISLEYTRHYYNISLNGRRLAEMERLIGVSF